MGNSSSSSHVDRAMLALDDKVLEEHLQKKFAGKRLKSKTSSKSKASKGELEAMLEDCEIDEILDFVMEMKRDAEGKKILDEFVHQQTDKKSRHLGAPLDDSARDNDQELPPTEIQIGKTC